MLRLLLVASLGCALLPATEYVPLPADDAVVRLLRADLELREAVACVVSHPLEQIEFQAGLHRDQLATPEFITLDTITSWETWSTLLDHPNAAVALLSLSHLLDQCNTIPTWADLQVAEVPPDRPGDGPNLPAGRPHLPSVADADLNPSSWSFPYPETAAPIAPGSRLVRLLQRVIDHNAVLDPVAGAYSTGITWSTVSFWSSLSNDLPPMTRWQLIAWALDRYPTLGADESPPLGIGWHSDRLLTSLGPAVLPLLITDSPGADATAPAPVRLRRRIARMECYRSASGREAVPELAPGVLTALLADPDEQVVLAGLRWSLLLTRSLHPPQADGRQVQHVPPDVHQDELREALLQGCRRACLRTGDSGVLGAGVLLQVIAQAPSPLLDATRAAAPGSPEPPTLSSMPTGGPLPADDQAALAQLQRADCERAWQRIVQGVEVAWDSDAHSREFLRCLRLGLVDTLPRSCLSVTRLEYLDAQLSLVARRHPTLALEVCQTLDSLPVHDHWQRVGDLSHGSIASAGLLLGSLFTELPAEVVAVALHQIAITVEMGARSDDGQEQLLAQGLRQQLVDIVLAWVRQADTRLENPAILRQLLADFSQGPPGGNHLSHALIPATLSALARDPTCQLEIELLPCLHGGDANELAAALRCLAWIPEDRPDLLGLVFGAIVDAPPDALGQGLIRLGLRRDDPWIALLQALLAVRRPWNGLGPLTSDQLAQAQPDADPEVQRAVAIGDELLAGVRGNPRAALEIVYAAQDASRGWMSSQRIDPGLLVLRCAMTAALRVRSSFAQLPAAWSALDASMSGLLCAPQARIRRLAMSSWASYAALPDLPLTQDALAVGRGDDDPAVRATSFPSLTLTGGELLARLATALEDTAGQGVVALSAMRVALSNGVVPGTWHEALGSANPALRELVAGAMNRYQLRLSPQDVVALLASPDEGQVWLGILWAPASQLGLVRNLITDPRPEVRHFAYNKLCRYRLGSGAAHDLFAAAEANDVREGMRVLGLDGGAAQGMLATP